MKNIYHKFLLVHWQETNPMVISAMKAQQVVVSNPFHHPIDLFWWNKHRYPRSFVVISYRPVSFRDEQLYQVCIDGSSAYSLVFTDDNHVTDPYLRTWDAARAGGRQYLIQLRICFLVSFEALVIVHCLFTDGDKQHKTEWSKVCKNIADFQGGNELG